MRLTKPALLTVGVSQAIGRVVLALSLAAGTAGCGSPDNPSATPASEPMQASASDVLAVLSTAGFTPSSVLPAETRAANGLPVTAADHRSTTGFARAVIVGNPVRRLVVSATDDADAVAGVVALLEGRGYGEEGAWLRSQEQRAAGNPRGDFTAQRPIGPAGTIRFELSSKLGAPVILVVLTI